MVTRIPLRRLAPLLSVSLSALVFAMLLVLVRLRWAPLERVDRGVANRLNAWISGDSPLVAVVKAVTWLGSTGVLWVVITAATVTLLIRGRRRLAAYVVITGAGALVLDPVLKSLVGRLRPVVAHPIAYGTGNSFPSGHSLGSIVCYGAVLLAFLPAVPVRWRPWVKLAYCTLIVLIGTSRLLLGVHYLSDVIGAWALGVAWLGLTAYAFQIFRQEQGKPVVDPVREGLEPEAPADLELATAEPEGRARPGVIAAGVVVVWVFVVGLVIGVGELVVHYGDGNVLGDRTVPHWFAAHRTASLTRLSQVASTIGATQAILIVSVATCVIAIAVLRRWRPVIFVVTVMAGELAAFLIASTVVGRSRPDVPNMDPHLPTDAYPSGHIAASLCIYFAIAILVVGHTRSRWRWLILIPLVVPALVTLSRFYRGEHHPTDALGSLLFAVLWTGGAYLLIRPNADHEGQPAAARWDPAEVAR